LESYDAQIGVGQIKKWIVRAGRTDRRSCTDAAVSMGEVNTGFE
jgi:hypothetical protein